MDQVFGHSQALETRRNVQPSADQMQQHVDLARNVERQTENAGRRNVLQLDFGLLLQLDAQVAKHTDQQRHAEALQKHPVETKSAKRPVHI